MVMITLPSPILWPRNIPGNFTAAPSFNNMTTLDAAGEYDAFIIAAREAMTISHVGISLGAATGSPTADIRIETVDAATGLPTGTLWATNTNIVTGTLSTGGSLHALTASASITPGQIFAVKIVYNSGTSLVTRLISGFPTTSNIPYQAINTGTPTKQRLTQLPMLALGSSATTFYSLETVRYASAVTNSTFNNTNSARRGVRFQVPFRTRCVGFRHYLNAAVGDYAAALFDDAGTELSSSSTAYEGDQNGANAGGHTDVYFDNAVTLLPGVWYRAAIEPSSATNCSITTCTVPSASYMSSWPGGANFHLTTFASGSWTDTATDQVPFFDLLLDQIVQNSVNYGIIG